MNTEPILERSRLPLDVLDALDRVCDRFEAAWGRGERPRVEDYLGEFDASYRKALLRDLLAAEVHARRRQGERPEPGEYHARFPDDRPAVAVAFAAVPREPAAAPPGGASRPDAGRDLFYGLIALQNGLIDQDQLVAAFRAWSRDRSRPLADHLVDRAAIDPEQRAALEPLVNLHLKKAGGDAARSLASLTAGRSTRERLAHLGDDDLEASLAHVGTGMSPSELDAADGDRTATFTVGTATADGQRFRVLRPYARGGLGAVFVALDAELNREVALKQILDRHADDPVSRQRFVIEAEITGGLEHPGIVPVYGLGTHSDGRPYYAMRFIKGDSLKEAIAKYHDGKVGSAVRTGLGARTVRTADPTATAMSLELRKLLRRFLDVCNAIDYAHARGVLHRDIKPGNVIVGKYGETLMVDWGMAKPLGKVEPGHDSGERTLVPSSASGSAVTLPGSALGTPAYMSPEQAAGELDKLGPRSDAYSLGATLYCLLTGRAPFDGEVGEVLRGVGRGEFPRPRQLDPTIDPALEAVCLKAMALKPEDRYPTARALADDVERWTADEPVTAWREPPARRARRWARRNRTAVTAATVALLAGVIGLGALSIAEVRANRRLRVEQTKTNNALAAETRAKEATEKALAQKAAALAQSEESRKQAQAVSAFLVRAFRSPDPSQSGRQVKVVDVLDQASKNLDTGFTGPEVIRGTLLVALGRTYGGLGLHDRAISLHRKALAVLETELGREHPDTMQSRSGLAADLYEAGQLAEAIKLFEALLRQKESTLGREHPHTIASRNNLAMAYTAAGRLPEAIAILEEILRLSETRLGRDHVMTLHHRNNLANAYRQQGMGPEAIAMHEGTLKLRQATLGPLNPDTLRSRNNLADALATGGRLPEAVELYKSTIRLREENLGPDHADTLNCRENLADAYEKLGRWTEAEGLEREALVGRRKIASPDSPVLAAILTQLGRNLLMQSRWSESEPLLRESLAIREKAIPNSWDRYQSMSLLGGTMLGQGRHSEAEPLIVRGYEGMKAREAYIVQVDRYHLAEAAQRVIALYEAWGRPEQVRSWRQRLGLVELPGEVFAQP